ncbi:MAG: DUF502 domain-containing protein [Isosphaeraceae bacterium]|nr:DUF502 domain-containing protein [Isosphaeraceae bacterium]
MASPSPLVDPVPPAQETGVLRATIDAIRTRVIGGLLLALPIALTFWIIYWLYSTLKQVVLDPIVWAVRFAIKRETAGVPAGFWWEHVFSPLIAIILVVTILYFLGLFVRSRLHRIVDWVLMHVPVVTTIYKALRNVFKSLDDQVRGNQFKRVVLVEFPHSGSRALAFVTNTLQDSTTGKTILCVCVLTGVVPPTGFTLFVPEELVTDIDWSVNQTLQAILSGGITAPPTLHYFGGLPPGASGSPIVDEVDAPARG